MAEDIHRQKTLALIRLRGPVLPVDVAKEIKKESYIGSAILSELVEDGSIKISAVKVGGSPLYYMPGQEEKLQAYTKYLHEKEREAFERLREKKVLRDHGQEAHIRVALRAIRDFAKPITVTINERQELFWRWYLITNQDALPYVKKILGPEKKPGPKPGPAPLQPVPLQPAPLQPASSRPPLPQPAPLAPAPSKRLSPTTLARILAATSKAEPEPRTARPSGSAPSGSAVRKPEQAVLVRGAVKEKQAAKAGDAFFGVMQSFFRQNDIEIEEHTIIKKKKEIDFIIRIPSSVGSLVYYCKAKDKKTCNDADLSTAYVQGQSRKLPVLFVTTGRLSKRAQTMLTTEFRHVTVKMLG